MPPLRLFGRSWHVSSDDLALPGLLGIAFHGTWSVLLILDVALIGLPDDCPQRQLATSCILWMLASFVLTTCLQVWVTRVSLRGAMLEEHKRANMPLALYCLLTAYCLEAGAIIMSTAVFFGVIDNAAACYTAAELARTPIHNLAAQRWFIYTTWAALGAVAGLLVLLYNVYPDRSLDAWVDRVTCLSYVLCCWRSLGASDSTSNDPISSKASAATPTVLRMAKVLGDVFYPLNFSFTDIVAAITLVGITHRSRAHGTGSSSHSHAVIAAAAAGFFGQGGAAEAKYAEAAAALKAAVGDRAANSGLDGFQLSGGLTQAASVRSNGSLRQVTEPATSSQAKVNHLAAVPGLQPDIPVAAATAAAGLPVSRSHQQLLQLLLEEQSLVQQQQQHVLGDALVSQVSNQSSDLASDGHRSRRGSWGRLLSPQTSSGSSGMLKLPVSSLSSRVGRSGMHRASSDGDVMHSGPTLAAPAADAKSAAANPVAAGQVEGGGKTAEGSSHSSSQPLPAMFRSGSSSSNVPAGNFGSRSSLWELAVRQASAAAVAPGYGVPCSHSPARRQGSGRALNPGLKISGRRGTEPLQGEPVQPLQSVTSSRSHSWAGGVLQGNEQRGLEPIQGSGSAGLLHMSGTHTGHSAGEKHAPLKTAQLCNGQQDLKPVQHHAGPACASTKPAMHAAASKPAVEFDAAALAAGDDDGAVPLWLLEEALHWHRYANAIYGWPMFMWSHRYRAFRCCGLCCGRCFKVVQQGVQLSQRSITTSSGDGTDGASAAVAAAVLAQAVGTPAAVATNATSKTAHRTPGPVAEALEGPSQHASAESPAQQTPGQQPSALQHQTQAPQHDWQQPSSNQTPDFAYPTDEPRNSMEHTACVTRCSTETCAHEPAEPQQDQHHILRHPPEALEHSHMQMRHKSLQRHNQQQQDADSMIRSCCTTDHDLQQGDALMPAPEAAGLTGGHNTQQKASSSHSRCCTAAAAAGASSAGGTAASAGVGSAPGVLQPDDAIDASCLCCLGGWGSSVTPKLPPLTASQRLTREAIVQTAKITDSALLHVNYHNLVEGLLPYSVVLDEARQCVVVAIRGSLSVEDCVTDILYDPAPLDADWLQPNTVKVSSAAAPLTKQPAVAQTAADAGPLAGPPAHSSDAGSISGQPAASKAGSLLHSTSSRQSPFATASAAAEHAAGSSSSTSQVPSGGHADLDGQQQSPKGQQQQSLKRQQQQQSPEGQQQEPYVPEAQAAAAAAAAMAPPQQLTGPTRRISQQQQQQGSDQQQLQQQRSGLAMQPSFWRHRLQRFQSLDARNMSLPPQQQQEQQGAADAAGVDSAGGWLKGLAALQSALHIPPFGQRSSQSGSLELPTSSSVKLPAGTSAGTSHRLHSSKSVNYARPNSGPSNTASRQRRSTAEQMALGQVQRTTAADRALGAARDNNKFGAAGAAAADNAQQQLQQRLQSASTLPAAAAANWQPAAAIGERLGISSAQSLQMRSEYHRSASHHQQQQQQHHQQQRQGSFRPSRSLGLQQGSLQDGGPTDWLLVTNATPMSASRTAAGSAETAAVAASAVAATAAVSPSALSSNTAGSQPGLAKSSFNGRQQAGYEPVGSSQQQQQQWQQSGLQVDLVVEQPSVSASAADQQEAAAAAAQADAAEETPDTGAAGDQWFAHEGILNCARAIRNDLQRLGLLEQLLLGQNGGGSSSSKHQWQQRELPNCKDWTLMLTGHSLGAGVAALLALHYRSIYPSVRCWCFGPPGGLMSPAAAASLKDICYSLISAKDMIPRMSLWTIERLRDEMMLCALRCKMPKLKLLLGAAFGRQWEESEVLRPLEELTPAQAEHYRRYRKAVNQERSLDPLRVRIAREFVPPGEIIWLERYKVTKPRLMPLLQPTVTSVADALAAATAAAACAAEDEQPGLQQNEPQWVPDGLEGAAAALDVEMGLAQETDVLPQGPKAATRETKRVAPARSMARVGSAALAAALAGSVTVTRLRPHFTDGLSVIVGGMVVSRNMFMDHVPDAQLAELKRLVRQLRKKQQQKQGTGGALANKAAGIAPVQQIMQSLAVT